MSEYWRVPVKIPEPVAVNQVLHSRSIRRIVRGFIPNGQLLAYSTANLQVPMGKVWEPVSIWFRVITDANVATRNAGLSIADSTGLTGNLGLFYSLCAITQESISSGYYCWAVGAAHNSSYHDNNEPWETNALPYIKLTEFQLIHPLIYNEQIGDNYVVNVIYDEYDAGA